MSKSDRDGKEIHRRVHCEHPAKVTHKLHFATGSEPRRNARSGAWFMASVGKDSKGYRVRFVMPDGAAHGG